MRRFHGESNALETINAAASVIASAENHVPQASPPQKRRWRGWWSIYCCFGFHRHRKRIGHAVLVPESCNSGHDSSAVENPTQAAPLSITLPFIAPPSSPASFLQSEPPSTLHSPVGMTSLTSMSASMYSPTGPASIFAIGPYAHETQLVSPPVFSNFTTEPSTAPFTPPPESVHFTTPSSPEVPFAQLLDPNLRNSGTGVQFPFSNYEFNSYQLYPGSPVGQLISPSSRVSGSGTSSPFPDVEFAGTGPRFLEFDISDPSHRISFEHAAEEASSCSELKQAYPVTVVIPANGESIKTSRSEARSGEIEHNFGPRVGETSNRTPEKASTDKENSTSRHQKNRSLTLGSLKEFNFDSTTNKGNPEKLHNNGPNWWANRIDTVKEDGPSKDWSFPVMQPDKD